MPDLSPSPPSLTPTPHHSSHTPSHPLPSPPSLTPTPDGAIYPCNEEEVRRCSQLCLTMVAFAKKPPCACTDGMNISRDNYTCIPLGKLPRKHNYTRALSKVNRYTYLCIRLAKCVAVVSRQMDTVHWTVSCCIYV